MEAGDAEAEEEASDPLIDQGLQASAAIYDLTYNRLKELDKAATTATLPREELRKIKKASLSMNRAFSQYVKACHQRENRLLVEMHLLRHAAQRDAVDRDANRARVYELLRKYRAEDSVAPGELALAPLQAQPVGNQQPSAALSSAPSGAQAVDRAIGAVARLDASIAQLSPIGTTHLHGAGILAGLKGAKYPLVAPSPPPRSD